MLSTAAAIAAAAATAPAPAPAATAAAGTAAAAATAGIAGVAGAGAVNSMLYFVRNVCWVGCLFLIQRFPLRCKAIDAHNCTHAKSLLSGVLPREVANV